MKNNGIEYGLWTILVVYGGALSYLGNRSYHVTHPYIFLIILVISLPILIILFRVIILQSEPK